MRAEIKQAMVGGALLAIFAFVGTGLVALTEGGTRERIAENERQFLLQTLDVLVNPGRYDNDPLMDIIEVTASEWLGTSSPVTVYRARLQGEPVALVIGATAPDGYSGAIRMLVAINADGSLSGVRVLSHRETPGLGDAIETTRSSWILGFDGKSLGNPPVEKWAVKRDGGVFDQFTGATITPRAVIAAVRRTLEYYEVAREDLW